jgi:hypothetical protein
LLQRPRRPEETISVEDSVGGFPLPPTRAKSAGATNNFPDMDCRAGSLKHIGGDYDKVLHTSCTYM